MTMTSRERIIAAIKHQPVDKIPVCPRMNWVTTGQKCDTLTGEVHFKKNSFDFDPNPPMPRVFTHDIFYQSIPDLPYTDEVDTQIDIKDETNTQRITSIFNTPAGQVRQVIVRPKAGKSQYGAEPTPHIAEYLIKDINDVEKVKYLLPSRTTYSLHGFLTLEQLHYDEALPLLYTTGPMDKMGGDMCKMTDLMMAYHTDRKFFDAVFEVFTELSLDHLEWAIEQGVRNFFLVYFYASLSSGWSPQIYKEAFLPVIKRQVEMIHDVEGLAFYYDDGALMNILPLLVDAGVDVVETCTPSPMGDFDIKFAKELYGDKITFKGGIDIVNVVLDGTPETIDKAIKEYLEIGAVGSGLLLGTTDAIRPETPKENVEAFFKSASKYAKEYAFLTNGSV